MLNSTGVFRKHIARAWTDHVPATGDGCPECRGRAEAHIHNENHTNRKQASLPTPAEITPQLANVQLSEKRQLQQPPPEGGAGKGVRGLETEGRVSKEGTEVSRDGDREQREKKEEREDW